MATKQTVADIMTREVTTLFEEDNLQEVFSVLGPYRFRHLPVVDGKKLVGILSHRDLLLATGQGTDHSVLAQAREARVLEETFLRDVMTTDVVTIGPGASLGEAAKRMLESRVGALPVVNEQNELLGIVTENDLLRVLADML